MPFFGNNSTDFLQRRGRGMGGANHQGAAPTPPAGARVMPSIPSPAGQVNDPWQMNNQAQAGAQSAPGSSPWQGQTAVATPHPAPITPGNLTDLSAPKQGVQMYNSPIGQVPQSGFGNPVMSGGPFGTGWPQPDPAPQQSSLWANQSGQASQVTPPPYQPPGMNQVPAMQQQRAQAQQGTGGGYMGLGMGQTPNAPITNPAATASALRNPQDSNLGGMGGA